MSLTFPGVVDDAGRVVRDVLNFGVLTGDVNGDGLIKHPRPPGRPETGLIRPTSANNVRIDVSADGTINILDAMTIRNQLNQIVPRMPVLKGYTNSGCLANDPSVKTPNAAGPAVCRRRIDHHRRRLHPEGHPQKRDLQLLPDRDPHHAHRRRPNAPPDRDGGHPGALQVPVLL